MNAAPLPIYNYAYTAWTGKVDDPHVFVGEMEASSTTHARSRIRALHRALGMKAPRTIQLAKPQFLRLHTDAPVRIRFHKNSKPIEAIPDVSAIRAQFPAFAA